MARSINIILSVLILTPAVLSTITINLNYDNDLRDSYGKKYDLKQKLTLDCTVNASAAELESYNVKWENEEGKDVKTLFGPRFHDKTKENNHAFMLTDAKEEDAGLYFCVVSKDNAVVSRANITLFAKIRVKTSDSLNFVEGESIRIPCQVAGNPSKVYWRVGNETYDGDSGRVKLLKDTERNVDNAIFVIEDAQMSDKGIYECVAVEAAGENEASSTTNVRIKDKYAALWPFLGICAEVFVLCAIILIYEKKRNKSELEESDTDQSPDQKNTPDHGKDSNLRHRQ